MTMGAFLVRRSLQSALALFIVSLIVFVGVYGIGNPVELLVSPDATPEEVRRITGVLGLDRPMWEQYGLFIIGALHGDLGNSFVYNQPAISLIIERLPATFELAFSAMFVAILVGIPLGLWAGLRPNSLAGRSIMAGSILGFSLPTFWVGLVLIMIFAVQLGWLPATGRGHTVGVFGIRLSVLTLDGLAHIALPALNLALFKMALVIRLTRAGVREIMQMDYVKFARAQGLTEHRVIWVHVMKNILIPVVTVLGLELGSIIAYSAVTESIFAWPGMGKLVIDAINILDRPIIVAYLMVVVLMFIVINLIVDVLYTVIDPRVRLTPAAA
jgi:peptide/nickel transport system permease protein